MIYRVYPLTLSSSSPSSFCAITSRRDSGDTDGAAEGLNDGLKLGDKDGAVLGVRLGEKLGAVVGDVVGLLLGAVGEVVGEVGAVVGLDVPKFCKYGNLSPISVSLNEYGNSVPLSNKASE